MFSAMMYVLREYSKCTYILDCDDEMFVLRSTRYSSTTIIGYHVLSCSRDEVLVPAPPRPLFSPCFFRTTYYVLFVQRIRST